MYHAAEAEKEMSEFKSTLAVRFLPETISAVWMLLEPLVYESDVFGGTITVPAGFVTDFVSFTPLKNIGQRGAVIHDFLYSCGDFDRDMADAVLKEALEYSGINPELAGNMFAAVQLFGARFTRSIYSFYGGSQP
jgi:membrane glycosyltransferase